MIQGCGDPLSEEEDGGGITDAATLDSSGASSDATTGPDTNAGSDAGVDAAPGSDANTEEDANDSDVSEMSSLTLDGDPIVDQLTHQSARVTVSLSQHSMLYIRYGTSSGELTERTRGETSFTWDTHRQTLSGLSPDTTYYFEIVAEDAAGNPCCAPVYSFTTSPAPTVGPGECISGATERDQYWLDEGYACAWSATPDASEVGMDGEAYVRGPKWSNGVPLKLLNITGSPTLATLDVANAPDGTPALRGIIPPAAPGRENRPGILLYGHQLGSDVRDRRVVFSHEVWYPCESPTQARAQQYIGFGPHWGADSSLVTPGGSVRPNPNRGWTFRVPVAYNDALESPGSGLYFLYTYLPDQPGPQGFSYHTFTLPQCGRWDLIELEVTPNRPASARNAVVNVYINGVRTTNRTNLRIREHDEVHARGFGMFLGRGNPTLRSEHFYRNQKIYTADY